MSDASRQLVNSAFDRFCALYPNQFKDRDHTFEFYTASLIMRSSFDLNDEEIQEGLTRTETDSGGRDGGVDAVYCFADQALIREDTKPAIFRDAGPELRFVIIQATTTKGFKEAKIMSLRTTSEDLFDVSKPLTGKHHQYNAVLLAKINLYRKFIKEVNPRRMIFEFYDVSMGDEPSIPAHDLAKTVEQTLETMYSIAKATYRFVNADDLYVRITRPPQSDETLKFVDRVRVEPGEGVGHGYIAFVKLVDFYNMISEKQIIKPHLFEANVRDYEGAKPVNLGIRNTLEGTQDPDNQQFWALNNGITIVAEKADHGPSEFSLVNPKIVNGLQTAREIHRYFSGFKEVPADQRLLVVRIVEPKTETARDRIIYATNSQTKIPRANLRATEMVHKKIEDYFLEHGFYYERRKNFYKNQGKNPKDTITITLLSQAVASILLKKPSDARARPSTLMADDVEYEKMFNENRALEGYLCCALMAIQAQAAVKSSALGQKVKNNIRFHVAYVYAMLKTEGKPSDDGALKLSQLKTVDAAAMATAMDIVSKTFAKIQAKDEDTTEDKIGKSEGFQLAVERAVKIKMGIIKVAGAPKKTGSRKSPKSASRKKTGARKKATRR